VTRLRALSPVALEMLASIHQHGLLSTPQLHALHTPGLTMRQAQRIFSRRRRDGTMAGLAHTDPSLVQAIGSADRTPTSLWFLTPEGRRVLPGTRLEQRPRDVTPEQAAGGKQAHTLRVNDVGVAFVLAARARGDECGPLAWRHEIDHPISAGARGKRTELVRPDSLLRYTWHAPDGRLHAVSRFVELDRGTMQTEDLEEKLRRYARLWSHRVPGESVAAWVSAYPYGFPEVLVVFCGKHRAALERRMDTLLAFAERDPVVRGASGLVVSCVLLDDLVTLRRVADGEPPRYVLPEGRGPFGPVCIRHDNPGAYVDWLGQRNGRMVEDVADGQGALL
jgi:hypothetical protein